MTWTYSGNPAASLLDEVRFLIGDKNPQAPLLQDEEIAWLLLDNTNDPTSAAIEGVEGILAGLARSRDEHVGSVSIRFSQDLAGFQTVLANLRRRQVLYSVPYAGGISQSDKLSQRASPDRVKPSFTRDLMQNPDDPETLAGIDDATSNDGSDDGYTGGLYGSD